jgi:transketolase
MVAILGKSKLNCGGHNVAYTSRLSQEEKAQTRRAKASYSVLTFNSSAMGMAAIGVALYKYVMKFSPKNGNYFNRDRFVLSNGTSRLDRILHFDDFELSLADSDQDMHAYGSTSSCILLVSKA